MPLSEGGKEAESRMREDTQEWRRDYRLGSLDEEGTEVNEIMGEIRFSAQQQNLS